MPIFEFLKVGFARFYVGFGELYGRISWKMVKKSGLLPVFENQKWAEKFGGIFWKWHFLGLFCPFLGDLRKFGCGRLQKSPLAHFFSYLIVIKSFNIYMNKASKVGFWPQAIFHTTNQSICQEIFYKKSFSFFGCYVIICVATMRVALFRCVSYCGGGRTFFNAPKKEG